MERIIFEWNSWKRLQRICRRIGIPNPFGAWQESTPFRFRTKLKLTNRHVSNQRLQGQSANFLIVDDVELDAEGND